MTLRSALRLNLSPVDGKPTSIDAALNVDTDNNLVRRAREGEYGAFETLFERHRTLVYRYAYQMAPRRDDAEDIVQEVFVRAYQNLHRYRDEAKFTTWLLRIAANYATDKVRMSRRRHALEQQEAAGSLVWMTANDDRDPVASLPHYHRNAIVMRDIQELEYDEIAAFFGCSVGGAKLRVLRARRALRDRLAPTLGES